MKTTRSILTSLALSCTAVLAQQPPPAPATPVAPAPAAADPFKPADPAADPFKRADAPVEAVESDPNNEPKQVSILFEAFSLDSADAAALLRSGLDGKPLYDKLLEKIGKKEVTQEALVVIRARSGEKALVEGISEQIYPTEYEPPQLPGSFSGNSRQDSHQNQTPTPATPTSFETRNTGWTLEVEPTLGASGNIIDLRFAPNYSVKSGVNTAGQGLSMTEMPVFETQRVDTALIIRPGIPFFIGTMNRPPFSNIDPQTAKRTWFAFVTGTVVTAAGVIDK